MIHLLLSACLIAKNESMTIRKCLESLEGVVDEIIVVDTGSTDDTIEIAKSCGAVVYHYEWDNHFGNARNESLKYAHGDFILFIDADEYLDAEQRTKLRTFLESTDAEGVLVSIRNYVGSLSRLSVTAPITVMRIFRRGHRFSGAIHEQVAGSVHSTGRPIEKFDLTLHHLGYINEFIEQRNKSARNIKLLENALQENPDDLFHRSNMMAEYVRLHDYEKCSTLGRETYERCRTESTTATHLLARVLNYLIWSLTQLGQFEDAEKYAKEATLLFPNLTDVFKSYASVLLYRERALDALPILEKCRELGDVRQPLIDTMEGIGTFLAAADLAEAWAKLGDDTMARKWYLQAFYENPRLESIIPQLLYLLPNQPEVLRTQLEDRMNEWVTAGVYAESYAVLGYEDASSVVDRTTEKFGDNVYTKRARMALAARQGLGAVIAECDRQADESARYLLGLYLQNRGDIDGAMRLFLQSGDRSATIKEILSHLADGEKSFTFNLGPYVKDLILMRADRVLAQWLPYAGDRNSQRTVIKYSPLFHVLEDVHWNGVAGWECEYNAQREFKNGNLQGAIEWLEKAISFSPTVTKVVIEADIALAHQNVDHARVTLFHGRRLFPVSQVLAAVTETFRKAGMLADAVAPSSNRLNVSPFAQDKGNIHIGEGNVPEANSMQQLYERGLQLANRVNQLAKHSDVNQLREAIADLQSQLEMCRTRTEVSGQAKKIMSATFDFYLKLCSKWFLQPKVGKGDMDSMVSFWSSWIDTWRKTQSVPIFKTP